MGEAKGQTIGYKRVSSFEQNTARQLDGIDLDEVFEDKASGKDTERPALTAMIRHARRGDQVVVHSMDRLARNLRDLKNIVDELVGKGVKGQISQGEPNLFWRSRRNGRIYVEPDGSFR